MDFAVSHPAFRSQNLSVRTAGLFTGPVVLLNGAAVKRVKGKYDVRDDAGTERVVQLKSNFIDAIPLVKIGNETVQLARPLRWYEYLWIGVPIVLMFAGGALGGGIGAFAAYSSSRIFRSDRSSGSKYALTGLISVAAFVGFFILAVAIQVALRNSRTH
jgi:hypothetical protein